MSLHEQIKNQIKDAMRAKDAIRLETLRGLSALFTNDLIAKQVKGDVPASVTALDDESATALIRRSVKQRKDSIEQFEKGGRADLAEKEKTELAILETFLPKMMSREDIQKIVATKLAAAGGAGSIDKAKMGQFMGTIMKDLKGKADGADVKAVIESLLTK
jgi:uncharacterized protein YqeY